ncbi:MAG TPA: UDP-2,3-diacylglucosamine diphosphatase [Bacteroidia bacterium]|nr:UDP-2,3-diacylglucosamine diphosphatase [Bacteroidia bacterium]HMU20329.1 UDP-2,3-diacylglucosamine diphosphatase [Bacteroidia bacterium]
MSNTGKKIYFISDFHLGAPSSEESLIRERKICQWLETIKADVSILFILGDVFDFWFEYRHVVPKGYVRILGKLAEIADKGIPIYLFTGNHDMWMFDYLPKELGIKLYRQPEEFNFDNRKFLIGHGDGLGPGDHGYKFIKKVFANKFCQWLFARLHPNFGISLANFWSRKSRQHTGHHDAKYLGDDKEYLVQYIIETEKTKHFDYYIFGHRHLPIDKQIERSYYINLGDWLSYFTYAEWDGSKLSLKKFEA